MAALILIRGGGDLASGIAIRLMRSGLNVLISELPQPLAVRRTVSFAEAVYTGLTDIEGTSGRLVDRENIADTLKSGEVPVIIDPEASILTDPAFNGPEATLPIDVLVDARLTKLPPDPLPGSVRLTIGIGPGFQAGVNCNAVIESRRSHTLGRVYWQGSTQPDSGLPEGDPQRVLRAPITGTLRAFVEIGEHVDTGQPIAEILPDPGQSIAPVSVQASFPGVLRGLIHPGMHVKAGLKIGDVDARDDVTMCKLVSDKALAIGGGVLEAILSRPELRASLWGA